MNLEVLLEDPAWRSQTTLLFKHSPIRASFTLYSLLYIVILILVLVVIVIVTLLSNIYDIYAYVYSFGRVYC